MANSKLRPDASASAASTDSDAKADPKSVAGVEEPASKPEETAPEQPAANYKAIAEAARAELDNLKAKLATQESLKSAGLAPELADFVTLNTPEDAQKLAAIIAPQPQATPFAPVGDDDSDENITTIGNRIFGRR